MLTREGYPTWPGGAQPKRKIFGHLAIVLVAFCQLELENNLFGTHFDMQYQVHLRKHLSYSTHSASKVKDEQMAENYKAGATLPLSPLTNVPSSATKFGLNSTQLNSLWMSCSHFQFASCTSLVWIASKQNFTNPTFFISFKICLLVFDKLIWIANHFVMEVLLSAHLNDLLNVTFLQLGQKTLKQLDGLPTGRLPEMWIYCSWWKHKAHSCHFIFS